MDSFGSLSKHCLCLQSCSMLQLRLGRLRSTMWNWADGALCHLWTACAHARMIVAGVPVDAREDVILSGVAKIFRTKKQEAPQTHRDHRGQSLQFARAILCRYELEPWSNQDVMVAGEQPVVLKDKHIVGLKSERPENYCTALYDIYIYYRDTYSISIVQWYILWLLHNDVVICCEWI